MGIYRQNPETLGVKEVMREAIALLRNAPSGPPHRPTATEVQTALDGIQVTYTPTEPPTYMMTAGIDRLLATTAARLLAVSGSSEGPTPYLDAASKIRQVRIRLTACKVVTVLKMG